MGASNTQNPQQAVATQQVPAPQQGQNIFNQASSGITNALGGAQAGMFYQPERISAGGIARDTLGYFNPFETQAVNMALGDIERARQIQANQLDAQATSAGAFGGSRQALMQSELSRNALQQAANTGAQMRLAGWQQGQNLASQAAQSNQTAGLQGAQQRLSAANQLGNLANLGFGMGQQAQQMQFGAGNAAYGVNQAILDAAKKQWAGYQGAPAQSLDMLNKTLASVPVPQSATTTREPGLFDYLTLGASMYS